MLKHDKIQMVWAIWEDTIQRIDSTRMHFDVAKYETEKKNKNNDVFNSFRGSTSMLDK